MSFSFISARLYSGLWKVLNGFTLTTGFNVYDVSWTLTG